ncbi:MAG TPA: hypothetical protein VG893_13190 [Terracidiphilus sp.]|nr:hypothetical protein [Terracidiphilus sp.]
MTQLNVPVALFGFSRLEATRRVFQAVAAARPRQLFVVVDGPRADRAGEAERCAEVRKILTAVDWPCEVFTNFAEKNLGCRRRIISGIDWVFSHVEEAIILEDDCLPDPSFFPYCAELLERYRDSEQIAYISGFNPLASEYHLISSYYFSHVACIWGWATWRRAWRAYDERLQGWPAVKAEGILGLLFPNKQVVDYWSRVFDAMYKGTGPNTWDYQWSYTCWMRNWLGIIPGRNLIQNIGFGGEATHTTQIDPLLALKAQSMAFPLHHPAAITPWIANSMRMHERFFALSLSERIRRRIVRAVRS